MLLADARTEFYGGSTMLSNCVYVPVRAVKLPLEGDVLKMDCEGCEYDVLLNIDPKSLPFREIGLEYHGSPKPLIEHLKHGKYKVRIMKHDAERGILYAYRRA